jgi:hypothetical protein
MTQIQNSKQQAFMDRIRTALGHAAGACREAGDCCTAVFTDETGELLDRIKNRTAAEKQRLLERLIEMAQPINLNIIALQDKNSVAAAIADLVKNKAPEWGSEKSVVTWQHPLLEGLNLGEALAEQGVPVFKSELEEYRAGEASGEKPRDLLRNRITKA